jgi:DNA-binding GntR family transcriptional regulator
MRSPVGIHTVEPKRCRFPDVSGHTPLREKAFERIRGELLATGPRAFGGRLVEQQLAVELEMSRTPVRDALRRLAVIGLVEEASGGGYVPRRVRLRDVREQFGIRLLLEPKAAELAAARAREDIDAAFAAIDAVGPAAADGSAFHLAVAEAAGNAVLTRSIATIDEQSFVLRMSGACSEADRARLRAGHGTILVAIRDGDPERARTAMRDHLLMAGELSAAAARALRRMEEPRA